MYILDTFLSKRLLICFISCSGLVMLIGYIEWRLAKAPATSRGGSGLPLAQAIVILLFVAGSYPALFGLRVAPTFLKLLNDTGTVVNPRWAIPLLFSLSLCVIPARQRPALFSLAALGICTTAALFQTLSVYLGMTRITPWPGGDLVMALLMILWVGYRFTPDSTVPPRERRHWVEHTSAPLTALIATLVYALGLAREITL